MGSRPKIHLSVLGWVLGRTFPLVYSAARDRWRDGREQAAVIAADTDKRLLVGDGALRVHAVPRVFDFNSICQQPMGSVSGGDWSDVSCWTCRRMVGRHVLQKRAGQRLREIRAALAGDQR